MYCSTLICPGSWGEAPYQWYAKNPQAAARFALAMEGTTRGKTHNFPSADGLADSYRCPGFGWDVSLLDQWFEVNPVSDRVVVIDVGGGSGHVCVSLAKVRPAFEPLSPVFKHTTAIPSSVIHRSRFNRNHVSCEHPSSPGESAKAVHISTAQLS